MARLKTVGTKKLFVKERKKKSAETEASASPVSEREPSEQKTHPVTSGNRATTTGKRTPGPSGAKLDRCALCNGRLEEGATEFMARAGGEVVIINNVPAYVCEQCGEPYYTAEISRKIDAVMREAHRKKLCVRPVPAGEVSLNT